jgi:hypothetical protein
VWNSWTSVVAGPPYVGNAFSEVVGPSGPLHASSIALSGSNGLAVSLGCAVVSGEVWCFPIGGSLSDSTDLGAGLGPTDTSTSPQRVISATGAGAPLTGIAQVVATPNTGAGGSTFCAVSTGGGGAWCWGHNQMGQLGNGGTGSSNVATPVLASASAAMWGVEEIRLSDDAACARKVDGSVWCWGQNATGELGVSPDSTTQSFYPVQVLFPGWWSDAQHTAIRLVSGPWDTFCAIMQDSSVVCWGHNQASQCGVPQSDAGSIAGPTMVLGAAGSGPLTGITDLAEDGWTTMCAKNGVLQVVCWGNPTGPYPVPYKNLGGAAAVGIVGPLAGGPAGLSYVDPSGLIIGDDSVFSPQPPCNP